MTDIKAKNAIDRAINFIDRHKSNKEHPKRIADDIIEGLKQVKLLVIDNVVSSVFCEDGKHEVMAHNGYCRICNKKIGCVL